MAGKLYQGDYPRRSAAMRAAAYSDPNTRCPFCLLTRQEYINRHGDYGAEWDIDHANPGDPRSPLRPAHAHCNRSAGATHGNQRRRPSSGWA